MLPYSQFVPGVQASLQKVKNCALVNGVISVNHWGDLSNLWRSEST